MGPWRFRVKSVQPHCNKASSPFLFLDPRKLCFFRNVNCCTRAVGKWIVTQKARLHEMKTDGRSGLVMVPCPVAEDSRCPACDVASRRVQGRYERQVAYLP